jgi:hypothetical protein
MTTLGPSTTPGTYEFQVLDLLHDPNANRWGIPQVDGYINEARRQLVRDTGCLRSLQSSYLTGGQEQYTFGQVTGGVVLTGGSGYTTPTVSFSGGGGTGVAATLAQSGGAVNTISFTSFGSGYSSVPSYLISGVGSGATLAFGILNVNTFDVLGVHIIWGTQRYSLQWKPFRVFSAYFRPYTAVSYQRQPVAWTTYGDTTIFLGPPPDQSYAVEFDTIILPTAFTSGDTTTVDPIPPLVQDPIKFYAAHLAKNNAQSFGEAEAFLAQYRRTLLEAISVYTGRVADVYQATG